MRITSAIDREPWGDVARQVEEYLRYASPYGARPLLHRALDRSKAHAETSERAEVVAEIADLIERTGLSVTDVACRIGTSRPRLSTYRSGRVIPSATLLVRLRALADRIGHTPSPDKSAP
ncbi:MAG: helix-turn-helix domain-containing protein [Dermatophilaceae bacterium]